MAKLSYNIWPTTYNNVNLPYSITFLQKYDKTIAKN